MEKLSIIIPEYNEVETLNEILGQVQAVKLKLEKEIILVDDFSTDGPRDILKQIEDLNDPSMQVFYHSVNCGKGAALRTGFQNATGDLIIIQDADLEYDPQDYPKLIQPIIEDQADVVYGSRFIDGMQKGLRISYIANRFLTFLSNLLTGLWISDMETCYKVIKTSILKEMHLTSDRFGIEPEITANVVSLKFQLTIGEGHLMKAKRLAGKMVLPQFFILSVFDLWIRFSFCPFFVSKFNICFFRCIHQFPNNSHCQTSKVLRKRLVCPFRIRRFSILSASSRF